MGAFLRKHLDDLLMLSGCFVLAYATWLVSPIGALFLVGIELIVLSVMVGLGGKE